MESIGVNPALQETGAAEAERRGERRYSISDPQIVELKIPPGKEVILAELVNISKYGVGLISADYISPGLQVMFRSGEQYVYARVLHCKPAQNGFAIGAVIRDVLDGYGESTTSPELPAQNATPPQLPSPAEA